MSLVTSRESWQAKHQALVESPLCEIRFAEMMCLGGNGDLARESLEILFNQAFLVRGLTRPSMLLPCLLAFIKKWRGRMAKPPWPEDFDICDCVSFNVSYSTNLSSFQSAFSQNLSMSCLRWVPWPDEFAVSSQIFAFPHPVHFAMSVQALPSCSCLFCSAFVILGVLPKVAHGAIFIKGITWCLGSPACLRSARFIISSVRSILTF